MLSYVHTERGLNRDRVQYRAETRRATRYLAPPPAPRAHGNYLRTSSLPDPSFAAPVPQHTVMTHDRPSVALTFMVGSRTDASIACLPRALPLGLPNLDA